MMMMMIFGAGADGVAGAAGAVFRDTHKYSLQCATPTLYVFLCSFTAVSHLFANFAKLLYSEF